MATSSPESLRRKSGRVSSARSRMTVRESWRRRAGWLIERDGTVRRGAASADVFTPQGGAHGLAHGRHGIAAGGRAVVAHMQFNAVSYGHSSPRRRGGIVVLRHLIGSGIECGCEGLGNPLFQRISGCTGQLRLDGVEGLSFALADLDGEELEQVPVMVGGGRSATHGVIQQTVGDIEPD